MDEDRHARVAGDREDRARRRDAELERLRARVELDAARAAGEAALGLADRVLGRVQAAVRDEPPAALGRPLEHAVVRDAVAGVAVGVVEGESARARVGRDLVEGGDERVERERLAVLVEAEMRVGVEDRRPGGQQRPALLAERGEGGLDGRRGGVGRAHRHAPASASSAASTSASVL